MDRDTFKTICRERRTSWGTVLMEHMRPHVVRTMARAGYDWLWIDNEHSCHSYETFIELARTARDVGIMSFVRVAQKDYALIARALDLAVDGIIVPRLETPEDVRHVIDCAKYPPIGKRGFGFRSTHLGKRRATMAERIEDQNERRFLFFQIESRLGMENLDAMLDTAEDHIDGVFFGPADFQMDLGRPDTPEDPGLAAAAKRCAAACEARNLSNGLPVGSVEEAKRWRGYGFNLIAAGNDDLFMFSGAADTREALEAVE